MRRASAYPAPEASARGRRRRRRVLTGLVLTTVLTAAAPAAAQPPADPDRLLARAMELHQAGDILGAIETYQEVLKIAPDRPDARSNLGAAFARLGRFEEAIEQYRRALAARDDPKSRFNLGLALYKTARLAEAAGELSRVVESWPRSEPPNDAALMLLADCYLKLGLDARAAALLEPHEARLGGDRAFAYLFGTALIRLGQLDRGQALVDRIFRGGESAEAHVLMGVALLERKDYPAAARELARAIALDGSLPSVHSLYGRALLGTGDQEGAIRAFQRELETNPNDFEANLFLGHLRKNEGRHAEARAYLTRAVAMRPDDLTARHALASLLLATGEAEQARQHLERVVAEAPAFVEAHVLLATVYYRLNRREDGDRHRAIVERLNAEQQARQPGAQDDRGPAYRGQPLPGAAPPKPRKPGEGAGDRQ